MNDTEVIELLRSKLATPVGRHLYGVVGRYPALDRFASNLQQAKTTEGGPFPAPLSVNAGILAEIPDDEFQELARAESRRPQPIVAHVTRAFERFLRAQLAKSDLVILGKLEMLFAYNVELSSLRALATDTHRVLLLLPGRRSGGSVFLFPELETGSYSLPSGVVAENHLWELDN